MSERTARWTLVALLTLYLALGVAYSVVNPIFESPDEALNYANIRFLVEEHRLPVLEPGQPTKAHHPPLYYVLGALLTFWVGDENRETIIAHVNPYWAFRSWEAGVDNKNLYLHDPSLEAFPYHDVALGVHLVRWLSLLMGAGTVLLVYRTAHELFPHRLEVATGAVALVALNPMFLFISSSVHDDALANLVAAAILYVASLLLVRGPTTRRAAALGLLLGLALLTKLTCLLVAPTAGLALLYAPLSHRGRAAWRELLRLGGVALALALLTGGWWLGRNILLYGEPTSMVSQTSVWGVRENAPDLLAATRELGFLHDSLWGVFGYGQIPLLPWTYGLARLLGLATLGGLALFYARRRSGRVSWECPPATLLLLLTAPLVAFLVNFARMTVSAAADFGRYMFVSLAILAPLYALGVSEWFPAPARRRAAATLAASMFILATLALVGVLRPAYTPPPLLSAEEVAARTQPADVRFGDTIHLVGYSLSSDRVRPGSEIVVTLCWQAIAATDENYAYFVHLLGPQESIVGARNTHPGLGRYPTSRWRPGDAFCDLLHVPVETWAPAPAVYSLEVGWYDPQSDERLPASDASGAPLGLVLLSRVKTVKPTYPAVAVPNQVDANLGDQITLLGYDIAQTTVHDSQPLTVTLYWTTQAPVPADYTVFVHLAAPAGPPYAQDDTQPQGGAYPTSFWDVGEVITDVHTLSIPTGLSPGEYHLLVGMYILESGERLPAFDRQGTRLPADAVPIGSLEVTR